MLFNYSGGSDKSSDPDGKNVKLRLEYNQSSDELSYELHRISFNGSKTLDHEGKIATTPSTNISITTEGCPGVAGKDGKNGSDGWRGSAGSNATQYSDATDGRRGTDGESGKPGTSGGPGGNGGDITVQVKEADTDLLAMIELNANGGEGGEKGSHGRGGFGGPGGYGGSGYSWRASNERMVYKQKEESYWDYESQSTKYRYYSVLETETYYTDHSRSAGRDGPTGWDGSTPTTPLYDGTPGLAGEIKIEVVSDRGSKQYKGLYNLGLVSCRLTSSSNNGIIEPGDTIELTDITIANRGHMPSPAKSSLMISLSESSWVKPIEKELFLIDEIPPGISMRIPGRLVFQVKSHQATVTNSLETFKRLNVIESIPLDCTTSRIGTAVPGFSRNKNVTIQFPVKIVEFNAPKALLPGEVGIVSVHIQNISNKPLGGDITGARTGRGTLVGFEIEQSQDKVVEFTNAQGSKSGKTAISGPTPVIEKGNTSELRGYITPTGTSLTGRMHFNVLSELSLSSLSRSGEKVSTERKLVSIALGVPYRRTKGAHALLVIDESVTKEDLENWQNLFTRLGLTVDIWDYSLYQNLCFEESSGLSGSTTLKEDCKNKLIILAHGNERSNSTTPLASFSNVSPKDLDCMLREMGASLYRYGHNPANISSFNVTPPFKVAQIVDYGSRSKMLGDNRLTALAPNTVYRVSVRRNLTPWAVDPDTAFNDIKHEFSDEITKKFPTCRFEIYGFRSENNVFGSPRMKIGIQELGFIEIRPLHTPLEHEIVSTAVPPVAITSIANQAMRLSALPGQRFGEYMRWALQTIPNNEQFADGMVHAFANRTWREIRRVDRFSRKKTVSSEFLNQTHQAMTNSIDSISFQNYLIGARMIVVLELLRKLEAPWIKRTFGLTNKVDDQQKINQMAKEITRVIYRQTTKEHYPILKSEIKRLRALWRNFDAAASENPVDFFIEKEISGRFSFDSPYLGGTRLSESTFTQMHDGVYARARAAQAERRKFISTDPSQKRAEIPLQWEIFLP
jgi:hypothetical protein